MDIQENKSPIRRSSVVSGSLAYYNLLAGINIARASAQKQRIAAEIAQASNKSIRGESASN